MQIRAVVQIAFALLFASLVSAQLSIPDSVPSSGPAGIAQTDSPSQSSGPSGSGAGAALTGSIANATGTATGAVATTAEPFASGATATPIWVSYYPASSTGVSKATVGAAIGGSFAASLLVLLGALFCLRYRARKMMVIAVEGANNADLGRRCDQLESEVLGLREQLDRLEAQRLPVSYGSGAVLYTHEKDVEAFRQVANVKDGKDMHPPTYAD